MMDSASEQAVRLLESLAVVHPRLVSFGARLNVEYKLEKWGSNNIWFSGSPCWLSLDGSETECTRGLGDGVYVVLPDGRWIVWGLGLFWDASRWIVGGEIELESMNEDSRSIRTFPFRAARTIDECILLIEQVTDSIVASEDVLADPRIRNGSDVRKKSQP
jgi:hypothetical protein